MTFEISDKILTATRERLAALDFSSENERIAAIEDDNIRLDDAIAKAEARCTEIGQIQREWNGRDPALVADALLVGDVETATKMDVTLDDLIEERMTLRRAISELQNRQTDNRREVVEIQQSTNGRVADAIAPLADAAIASAKAAGETLVTAWAAISALDAVGRTGGLADANRTAGEAIGKLHAWNGLLGPARFVDTPEPILKALAPLASAGKSALLQKS